MKEISSENNATVKNFIKIIKGKNSDTDELLLPIEGFNLIGEALENNFQIKQFFYAPEISKPALLEELFFRMPDETEKIMLSDAVFKKLSDTETPVGVAALVSYPVYNAKMILAEKNIKAVVVDGIQDPGNYGTIIRTAAAAGFDAVFFTKGTVNITNPKVLRSTAGAVFRVKVLATGIIKEFCDEIKLNNHNVIAADTRGEVAYGEADYGSSFLIIIGNESRGISEIFKPVIDLGVRIPLATGVDSLNAAVAAGIIIFEAQKRNK